MIRIFRYEWIIWLALAGLLASAWWTIPKLRMEFSFQESLAPEHPTRVAYHEYEKTFGLGPSILLLFSGPDLHTPPMMEAVEVLSKRLRRLKGTREVTSALDIREPTSREGHVSTRRPLGPEVYQDAELLAAQLANPAFRARWDGMLLDARGEVFHLVLRPRVDVSDPLETLAYLEAVEGEVEEHFRDLDLEIRYSGMFFVNQETLRTTARDQARLMILSSIFQTVLITLLFGSLVLSLMVFGIIQVAVLLSFQAMAWLDLPLNFMSGNLPVMVGVIGLADLIHILGAYCRSRRIHSPRGAAIRAMRATALPNLLTTLTTVGCILVTAWSPLAILESFSLSLSLGVLMVYGVTIVLTPLLLQRLPISHERGWIFPLQDWIRAHLARSWLPRATGRTAARLWTAFLILTLVGVACQEISSNWFRNFTSDHRVTRGLDFLHAHGKPVSSVQYTLATGRRIDQLLGDPVFAEEFRSLSRAIEALPGVCGVYSLLTLKEAVDSAWEELEFPPSLAPHWIEARRQSLYRQFLAGGAFDAYYSGRSQELRVVVTTSLEDSRGFQRLQERMEGLLRSQHPTRFRTADFVPRGHTLYWTEIVDSVATGYFRTLAGSLIVCFLCFLLLTGSVRHGLLALVPNLAPLLAMFAAARALGFFLNENFCSMAALSIGISVDDTLHLLYHYGRARRRRPPETPQQALQSAFQKCGAPVLVTSCCLVLGFGLCVQASLLPIVQTGLFLTLSVLVALLADLSLLPLLLIRSEDPRSTGSLRQYGVVRKD